MKTTQEWFEQLPEDYRGKALKNMIDPTAEHYSLAGAISNGFVWNDTPEGKDYWNGVFREVMYGEKFTPIEKIEVEMIQETEKVVESTVSENLVQSVVEKESPTLEISIEDEKGGNSPDLLKKYKTQKEEIK